MKKLLLFLLVLSSCPLIEALEADQENPEDIKCLSNEEIDVIESIASNFNYDQDMATDTNKNLLRFGCGPRIKNRSESFYNKKKHPSCKKVLHHLKNNWRQLLALRKTQSEEGSRLLDSIYKQIDDKAEKSL